MTRVLLSKARIGADARLDTCLKTSAGVFIVALGADYIGFLPQGEMKNGSTFLGKMVAGLFSVSCQAFAFVLDLCSSILSFCSLAFISIRSQLIVMIVAPEIVSDAMSLIQELAASGLLLMLGACATQWLLSTEAEAFMDRIQEAQLARVASQNQYALMIRPS